MKQTILFIYFCVLCLTQDDSPGNSAPMQVEVQIFGGQDEQTQDEGIFQVGMSPMDQFFLQDLFETITAAFDGIADDPNDASFLQEVSKQTPPDNEDVIQIQSPLLGLFNPFFTIFQTQGDADFVEIETISINGQKQTKVTKTSTRNGITTTTTEISTENSIDQIDNSQLSDDFILQENPVIEDAEKFIGSEETFEEQIEIINQINLDKLESIQDLHIIQDNYVKNELIEQTKETEKPGIMISLIGGLGLAVFMGYAIKKCVKNQ